MSEMKLWFGPAVDVLLRKALGADFTPALQAELASLGIDFGKPLLPAYELAVVTRAVELVAQRRQPPLPREAALRQLGRDFLTAFQATAVGGAMMEATSVSSGEKSMARMERNFRTGTNYMRTRYEPTGDGNGRLWVNELGALWPLWEGMVLQGGTLIGRGSTSTYTPDPQGPGGTFEVRSTPAVSVTTTSRP